MTLLNDHAIRNHVHRHWRLALIGCLLTITGLACGGSPAVVIPTTGQLEADRLLFERGSTALEESDWPRAREYFVQIRDNYPQSQYRAESRLAIGDTYEGEGTYESYVMAIDEYRDFLSLYPTHSRAPYAQFKVGLVHHHRMRRAERDQTETNNAVLEFEAFLARYPADHELVPQIRERLREAYDRLSEHDYTVGYFYYRYKNYLGAINRFRQILDDDPTYTQRDQVYFHLAESLVETNEIAEAVPYYARLLEEFESSEYAEKARTRIAELEVGQER
jgi:outer membrane protein assembly factor BamD